MSEESKDRLVGKELLEKIASLEDCFRDERMIECGYLNPDDGHDKAYKDYYQAIADAEGVNIDNYDITSLTHEDIIELAEDTGRLIMKEAFYKYILNDFKEKGVNLMDAYSIAEKIGLKIDVKGERQEEYIEQDLTLFEECEQLSGKEFIAKINTIPTKDWYELATIEACGYSEKDENIGRRFDILGFFKAYRDAMDSISNELTNNEFDFDALVNTVYENLAFEFYMYIDEELCSEDEIEEIEAYAISKQLSLIVEKKK